MIRFIISVGFFITTFVGIFHYYKWASIAEYEAVKSATSKPTPQTKEKKEFWLILSIITFAIAVVADLY